MIDKRLLTPVLIGGCLILLLNFSLRASFGVFQIPVADTFGWPREVFSIAIAIQNLTWGLGQPLFGAMAERFGDRWAIIVGAVFYAAGLVLTGIVTTPATMMTAAPTSIRGEAPSLKTNQPMISASSIEA